MTMFAEGIRALMPPEVRAKVGDRRKRNGSVRKTLERLADSEGLIRGYSIRRIAELAGVTTNGCRRCVRYMREVGQLELVRKGDGKLDANVYRLITK